MRFSPRHKSVTRPLAGWVWFAAYLCGLVLLAALSKA